MWDSRELPGADLGSPHRLAMASRYECEACGVAAPALGLCTNCRAGYARRVKAADIDAVGLARLSGPRPIQVRFGRA